MVTRSAGPFTVLCPSFLDGLVSGAEEAEACGRESCDPCGLRYLIEAVALTASVLDGGNSMVLNVTTQKPGLPPGEAGAFLIPRAQAAIDALRRHYSSFEAHWSIEQSETGLPNLHVLQRRGSRPKLDRLRAVFDSVELGHAVAMEPIASPLRMACYVAKIALFTLRQPSDEAGHACMEFARAIQGPLHKVTRHFHPLDPAKRSRAIERWAPHVLGWAETYDFEPKMPSLLQDRLATLRAREED